MRPADRWARVRPLLAACALGVAAAAPVAAEAAVLIEARIGDAAVRLRVEPSIVTVDDALQGRLAADLSQSTGDYVIVRRDALPAYYLASVLDDAEQGITDIVRGVDLLESTLTHVHLQSVLELRAPRYYHVPVVVNAQGQKLSKQTGATAVAAEDRGMAAKVLQRLDVDPPAD